MSQRVNKSDNYRIEAKGPGGRTVRTVLDGELARGVYEKLCDNPHITEVYLQRRFVTWRTLAYYKKEINE